MNISKSVIASGLAIILVMILLGTYLISQRVVEDKVQNNSNASESGEPFELSDENVSDPNLPYQNVTSMPVPTLETNDPSAMSPDECESQGGLCVYDLKCSDFGRVASGICESTRPNGMPVDCCTTQ